MSSKISTPFQQEDNKIQSWRPGSKFYGLIPADKKIIFHAKNHHHNNLLINMRLKPTSSSSPHHPGPKDSPHHLLVGP
jgi:hypothetical protein